MPRARVPVPPTPEGLLTTQALRERGWTDGLIRTFLPQPDGTRPSGLRFGRRTPPPVKLYREERVDDVERGERFMVAQERAMDNRERAARARQTQKLNRERRLKALAAGWTPHVEPLPLRKGSVNLARKAEAAALQDALDRVLKALADGDRLERERRAEAAGKEVRRRRQQNVKPAEARLMKQLLSARLDAALAAAYPWFPQPEW